MSNKDEEGVLGAESVAMTDSSSERMAKSAAESTRVWWLRGFAVSVESSCFIKFYFMAESWEYDWLSASILFFCCCAEN